MKTRFRPRPWILIIVAVLGSVLFLGVQKPCACSETAPANALPSSATSDPSQAADFTMETVLLKLPTGQNEPPLELTLKQLMDSYKVPGLSVAVIDNYKIAWAKGFGVTEPGGSTPVTTSTLFQAGSISKPVAAAGAMWLVAQGKLSLDEDVNTKLKTRKIPE